MKKKVSEMRYVLSVVFTVLFSFSANAGYEYSRFFKLKDEVKEVLAEIAISHSNNKLSLELLSSIVGESIEKLNELRDKTDFEYSISVDQYKNMGKDLKEGFGSISTIVQYHDTKGNISWELKTIFTPKDVQIYSTPYEENNEAKGVDDYLLLFTYPLKKSEYKLDMH